MLARHAAQNFQTWARDGARRSVCESPNGVNRYRRGRHRQVCQVASCSKADVPYRTSRAAISATCLPWKRAMASSFSEGSRDPSEAVIVEAP